MRMRDVWSLVKDSGVKFWDDQGPRLGAALAYYIALSLSPLLLVVVAVAGMVFGREAARGEMVGQFRDTIGTEAAAFVEQMIAKGASPTSGIIATVIAVAILLIGASSVFAELQSALNAIWKVDNGKSAGGVLTLVKERLLSFSLVCGTAFLLLVSLAVTAALSSVNGRISGWLPEMHFTAGLVNFTINITLTTILFAMIFKWLPQMRLAWRDVGVGAAVTAALFSLGRYLIGLYLGRAAVGSTYGAAGAFVVLLVWIYYSTQILLFGAELTFVYAQRFGSGVRAADGTLIRPPASPSPKLTSAAMT